MEQAQEGIELLRRQMVRRLPTATERAQRRPFVLTPRDRQILEAVYLHGVLTTDLIDLAFFSPPPGGRRSTSPAYVRLRHLWLWSYLERIEPPMARALGGRQPFWYTLGSRGVSEVAQHLNLSEGSVQRRRLERMDDVFVEHDLKVAGLWAHLQALLRRSGVRQVWWAGDRALRARTIRVREPGSGAWLSVLPDACFALEYPDRTIQCCMLEVDMGTLSLRRFARKLRALELAQEQGVLEQAWGYGSCEVLVLTHSRGRLQQLWRVARHEVAAERWSGYQFASFAILDPERFPGKVWRTLEDEWVGLLHEDALETANTTSTEQR